jgi:hypothetical protein
MHKSESTPRHTKNRERFSPKNLISHKLNRLMTSLNLHFSEKNYQEYAWPLILADLVLLKKSGCRWKGESITPIMEMITQYFKINGIDKLLSDSVDQTRSLTVDWFSTFSILQLTITLCFLVWVLASFIFTIEDSLLCWTVLLAFQRLRAVLTAHRNPSAKKNRFFFVAPELTVHKIQISHRCALRVDRVGERVRDKDIIT